MEQLPEQLLNLKLQDYQYLLPEERIAKYPKPERGQSKLLVYNKGNIKHITFNNIIDHLPDNSILFFNNTKVIPARLFFSKATGAKIEIFLLRPEAEGKLISEAMSATKGSRWHCKIGNLSKWKNNEPLNAKIQIPSKGEIALSAYLISTENQVVEFSWENIDVRFIEIVEAMGKVPLPPYLKREPETADKSGYQTVYSKHEGAVAAPTAGLHFSDNLLEKLARSGINTDFLTLHVSAGTFAPVKDEQVIHHPMHSEQVVITRKNLETLLAEGKKIIAVGTTALRTLESLYWYGVNLLNAKSKDFKIEKLTPYQTPEALPNSLEAIKAVWEHMNKNNLHEIAGETEIYIVPGYQFRICSGLITNYHQPGSTLVLLVAAFVGENWRKIYSEAMENNYSFLSYGDSSLLLP